jgi:hypothetical protein
MEAFHTQDGAPPKTGCIENIANISDWLEPSIATMTPTLSRTGITKFHQFQFTPNSSGTNVHMGVKEWASDNKPFTGLIPGDDYHVVFKDTYPKPKAADMATDVPCAQRKQLPVSVGVDKDKVEHVREKLRTTGLELMAKGIKTCCQSRNVPSEAAEDLRYCLALVADQEKLPFNWDTSMYTESQDDLAAAASPAPSPVLSPLPDPDSPVSSPREAEHDAPPELQLAVKVGDYVLIYNDPVGDQPFVIGMIKGMPTLFPEHKDEGSDFKQIYVW